MKDLIFDIQRFGNISNATDNTVITGNTGNSDYIVNSGSNVVINFRAEGGNIDNYGSNVTIIDGVGRGNKSIDSRSKADFVTIQGGKGSDEVRNYSSHALILGEDGGDRLYNNGNTGYVILNKDGSTSYYNYGGGGGYYSTILGGAGYDVISNDVSNVVIMAGGEGNDVISNNEGSNVTIDGGDGNDKIINQASDVTINGGDGNDLISSFGSNVLIGGGDGDDTISTGGSNYEVRYYDTIIGGKGDDYIDNGTGHDKDIYFYNVGDGNDTIYNFSKNDTLMIANSDYTTIKTEYVFVVNVGDGSITLTGLGDDMPIIKTTSQNIVFPTIDAPTLGDISTPTITPEETVKPSTPETISPVVKPSSDTSDTANSSNEISSNINSTPIIINNYYGDYYDMSGNNGTIVINSSVGGDVTNNTNIDNSTTIIKEGNTYTYNGGNKIINNYNSGEILSFAASYTDWTTDNNDLVINAAEGSVRITDANNKLVEVADAEGNVVAHVYKADNYEGAIDGRGYGAYEVITGSDNVSNQIFAAESGSSLWGGRGNSNDDLYGNLGIDEYIYSYGNGQDNIFQSGNEDTIHLLNISLNQISGAEIKDNGVNLQFTDGGSLNISGQVGTFALGGQHYGANYQSKTWYAK